MKNFDEKNFASRAAAVFGDYIRAVNAGEEREYVAAIMSLVGFVYSAKPELAKELASMASIKLAENNGTFQA